ncbi:Scn11a [Symbiodinium microadriaticum]|nr:Scn11a [Symbiodinium microadriaticum]
MSKYAARSTCPWGSQDSVPTDAHTVAAMKAARRREANMGGSRSTVPWNENPAAKPTDGRVPPSQAEIEADKMDFIQQCFEKGMSEDEVYDALEQYQAPLRELNGLESKGVVEDAVTMADRRARAKKLSDASVATYDAEKSRSAYMDSQNKAAEARNKNRVGSGRSSLRE